MPKPIHNLEQEAGATECESFLRQSGFYQALEREVEEARIKWALWSESYTLMRSERVPTHRLIIVRARRPIIQEPRSVPRIRRALLRAFRNEGFRLTPDLLNVRHSGGNVLVSVGILEA